LACGNFPRLRESYREAEAKGLLKPASLESLVREALRRRRIDHLFEVADRLTALHRGGRLATLNGKIRSLVPRARSASEVLCLVLEEV